MQFQWKQGVVADRFEDEYVVAQLNTGLYFSLRGGIVEVLSAMPFSDFEEAVNAWNERCAPAEEEEEALRKVWAAVLADELVDQRPAGTAATELHTLAVRIPSEFARFGDMQDLLALDIIHEVDDMGWPEQDAVRPAEEGASEATEANP